MADEVSEVVIRIKSAAHEQLDGMLGGDDSGHFHLTEDERDLLDGVLNEYQDELAEDDTFHKLRDGEYNRLIELLDILYPTEDDNPEEILANIIRTHTAQYVTENDIIDGGVINH